MHLSPFYIICSSPMTQMGFLANLSLPSTPMYFDLGRCSMLILYQTCCACNSFDITMIIIMSKLIKCRTL